MRPGIPLFSPDILYFSDLSGTYPLAILVHPGPLLSAGQPLQTHLFIFWQPATVSTLCLHPYLHPDHLSGLYPSAPVHRQPLQRGFKPLSMGTRCRCRTQAPVLPAEESDDDPDPDLSPGAWPEL